MNDTPDEKALDEALRIRLAMLEAKTPAELTVICAEQRAALEALERMPHAKPLGSQIRKLKGHLLRGFGRG